MTFKLTRLVAWVVVATLALLGADANAADREKKLPRDCADGQVAKVDAAGNWVCAADNDTLADANPNPDPPCFDNLNRYVDCGNGTVTDTVTGLIWLQDANCLNGRVDYATGNRFAASLADGDCGLTDGSSPGDWRLPTKSDWEATTARASALGCTYGSHPSLTNDPGTACLSAGPTSFFGVRSDFFYWSSTGVDGWSAWSVSLHSGSTLDFLKGGRAVFHVWPVRAGR